MGRVGRTGWVAVVADRPKSVHNRCVSVGVVCVVTLPFWHFRGCRGFCHRTESDLLLFVPNVRWYSGTWPYTMTPSIDEILQQFATLLPNLTLLPILTLLPNFGGFHRTLKRVRLAYRGRLLLRTPGPVPFGTCNCSCVETIFSWACHVCGPFEFRASLGTSVILIAIIALTWYSKELYWKHRYMLNCDWETITQYLCMVLCRIQAELKETPISHI